MNHPYFLTLHNARLLSKTHRITDYMVTLIDSFHPTKLALLQSQRLKMKLHQNKMMNIAMA